MVLRQDKIVHFLFVTIMIVPNDVHYTGIKTMKFIVPVHFSRFFRFITTPLKFKTPLDCKNEF